MGIDQNILASNKVLCRFGSTVVQPSSRLPHFSSSFFCVSNTFLLPVFRLGWEGRVSGFGFSSVQLFKKFSSWLRVVKRVSAFVAMRRGSGS